MLENLLKPEIQELLAERDLWGLRRMLIEWEPVEISRLVDTLQAPYDMIVFRLLPHELAADAFEHLTSFTSSTRKAPHRRPPHS